MARWQISAIMLNKINDVDLSENYLDLSDNDVDLSVIKLTSR